MIKGDFSKLARLRQALERLPLVVAQKVAQASASTITALQRDTFNAGENAYGDRWEPREDGKRATLHKSGRLASGVSYAATGTRLRARLGPSYAKYQVGRRPVFPRNGARLPVAYVEALSEKTNEVIRAELGKVADV